MPYANYRRTVTLTSKGQITLPVELRRSWDLKKGDRLDFTVLEDGSVQVRKHVRLSIHGTPPSLPHSNPARNV